MKFGIGSYIKSSRTRLFSYRLSPKTFGYTLLFIIFVLVYY